MKIVIDIDERYYEIVKHDVEHGNEFLPFKIIANGTPLPEISDRIEEGTDGNLYKLSIGNGKEFENVSKVLDSIKGEVVDNDKVMMQETPFSYQAIIPVDEVVDIIDKYGKEQNG